MVRVAGGSRYIVRTGEIIRIGDLHIYKTPVRDGADFNGPRRTPTQELQYLDVLEGLDHPGSELSGSPP